MYRYSGYLRTLLESPDVQASAKAKKIVFNADDLAQWHTKDIECEREWKGLPVHRTRREESVRILGRFEDVRRIDNLSVEDARFWVPLSTLGVEDSRLPIDLRTYPVAEITYRCTSDNARPAWVLCYEGGAKWDGLHETRRWRTIARLVRHNAFPDKIDNIILRLYSGVRTTESFEVSSICFREMTPAEEKAVRADGRRIKGCGKPARYPILDEFMPMGVCMDAETTRRLAETLGVSLSEYWGLAFEDIVRHHHNCVSFENISKFSKDEWRELLALADAYQLKVVASHDFPLMDDPLDQRELIEEGVKPYADSPSLLAWSLEHEPPEHELSNILRARGLMREADAEHPTFVVTRQTTAFPLYAPHFPIAGVTHYTGHCPLDIAPMVQAHLPLVGGQQFWVFGSGFTYATGTPPWNTCPEMRLMVNLAVANGVRGWFTFSYHNDPVWIGGRYQRSLTGPFLTFSDLWAELDESMALFTAMVPLLLHARPAPLPEMPYLSSQPSDAKSALPRGVPPTTATRLVGDDFELYFIISNTTEGMISLNLDISSQDFGGREVYDLTDFIHTRQWAGMPRQRHLEMFPGQARMLLVADAETCIHWRDVVANRLIEDDRRQLAFNLELAKAYGLDVAMAERFLHNATTGDPLADLETMDKASDLLINTVYDEPAIFQARSHIIEASAAVCACDGALCRLMNRGKVDQAREWGLRVAPFAREFTTLRLELRRGQGSKAFSHCEGLAKRALALLNDIRANA
jgi:hypothetical protein